MMGVFSESELADCSDNGDDAAYVCAVARSSLRGLLKGNQNPPRVKLVRCLDFHHNPYVREFVATEAKLIIWKTKSPQSQGEAIVANNP